MNDVDEIKKLKPYEWNTKEYFYKTIDNLEIGGLWLEFGVATGRTINIISEKAEGEVFGFDTFTGLPEDWGDGWQAKGVFSQDGELPEVNDNVELIVGLFQDTLESFLEEYPYPAAYIHIDCDLYSSTKYVLDQLESRIVPGTIISFDEIWNNSVYLESEMKAWTEFVERTNIKYKWISRTSHEQASLIIL